ncbi:czcB, partial [Symbiodinium necroappetens]
DRFMWVSLTRRVGACCLLASASIAALTQEVSASESAIVKLEDAITRTLERNPTLVAFGYQIEAQQGRVTQSRLRPNPELGVTIENALGSGEFEGIDRAETTLSLSWVLERGKRERRVAAANAGVSLLESEAEVTRLDVAAETARLYLDSLANQERLKRLQEAVTLSEQTVTAVKERVQAGRTPDADLARAEASLAYVRLDLEDVEHELLTSNYRLAAQWGERQPDFIQVTGNIELLPKPEEFEHLLARVDQSPNVFRYLSQQRLREAELRLAQADAKPNWRVNAGIRRIEGIDEQAFVAGITIPLAMRNRNQGGIAEARAKLQGVDADRIATQLQIETHLFARYQELQHSLHQTKTLRDEVLPRVEQALADTQSAYASGIMGCSGASSENDDSAKNGHGEVAEIEPVKGPNRGRLLIGGDFVLELAIFETGVPPEFRVWVTNAGAAVAPEDVSVHATLTRLGDVKDEISFDVQDDFLRGDTVIYEPHSFVVSIEAKHRGATHRWRYANFEGRTRIGADVAEAFGLQTDLAGSATIHETIAVYGRVVPNTEKVSSITARFDGVVRSVDVSIGDTVQRGQKLATIESNESLKPYGISAPIAGIVTERNANPGEQTAARQLFKIVDISTVWAELSVFPSDRPRVSTGTPVTINAADGGLERSGVISQLNPVAEANQSVLARVVLDNSDGALVPGMYLTGEIQVAEHPVPLAVKRTGLQAFRDFTVVYAQIGDEYEVRMLDLGRQDGEWIEVLGGLEPGTRYVTTNSYLIKADIEKSGASHDH